MQSLWGCLRCAAPHLHVPALALWVARLPRLLPAADDAPPHPVLQVCSLTQTSSRVRVASNDARNRVDKLRNVCKLLCYNTGAFLSDIWWVNSGIRRPPAT